MADPSFDIPARPERHFPSAGGVEYRGGSVFELAPETATAAEADLVALVDGVLADGPYQYREFGALPMPLWLVRDVETGDTFRVAVRAGEIRLHVLPETESPGLAAFYRRLRDHDGTGGEWAVSTRIKE